MSKTSRPALEHLAVAGVQLVLLVLLALLVLPPPPLPHPAGHLLLQVGEHPGHQPVELFVANWIVIQLTECNNVHLVNTWHGLLDLLRHCSNRQTERKLAKEQLIWNQSILGIKDLEKTILELFIACNAAHLKSLMEDMKMTIQKDDLCRI